MELERWLHIFDELFAHDAQIDRIVTCHNGIMERQEMEIRKEYMIDLYNKLLLAKSNNQ
jgi:hypothetical protein